MIRYQRRKWFLGAIYSISAAASIYVLIPPGLGYAIRDHASLSGFLSKATGGPQLISVEAFPSTPQEICPWLPASFETPLTQAEDRVGRTAATENGISIERRPLRVIRDPYPNYSAVTVDMKNDEIILQDENLFQIMTYDRMANTPSNVALTEPKRIISGPNTEVEFNCGLYVDQNTGDIYSVNNDTLDALTVFSRNARGNVHPDRKLTTPHRTFGIAVDEKAEELFLTVEHPPALVVYRKFAKGNDAPLRIMEGPKTGLADPHGIALDTRRGLMYISNHGSVSYSKEGKNFLRSYSASGDWVIPSEAERRKNMITGSGEYRPPSITVHAMNASGDAAPLRVIEGPNTRLNWPAQMYFDEEHGELFVANDVDDSILVFGGDAAGNVPPTRLIRGTKTGLKNPTGVFYDKKNGELVVANMGNHTATVYNRTANGNVAPLRTIRSGPLGHKALAIGNPGAVAYDTKRDEILVPN